MKDLRKRLISAMLCAVLPTLNISFGGFVPDTVKVDTEMITASAEDATMPSIFDDNAHGTSEVTSNSSIRNADPYGTANGQWNNVLTISEVYGVNTNPNSTSQDDAPVNNGAFLEDISDGYKTERYNHLYSQNDNYHLVAVTGMDMGNGKDDTVASISYDNDNSIYISLNDPTTGGAKVSNDFKENVTTIIGKTTTSTVPVNAATGCTIAGADGKGFDYLKDIKASQSGAFLSIAAGDFDGDGKDTIITYIPEWKDARIVEYKVESCDANKLDYQPPIMPMKYTYEGKYYTPVFKQTIVSDVYESFKLQTSSKTKAGDRQRDIPLVDLVAADIDKDGRDELIVTAGLGNTCDGDDSTTKMRIYDYHDGAFQETYTLELVGNYNNKAGRLRWASSAVGNLKANIDSTSVDFPEIVTAGWVDEKSGKGLSLQSKYGVHVTRLNSVKKENDGSYTGNYALSSEQEAALTTYGTTDKKIDMKNSSNLDGVSDQMLDGLHTSADKIRNKLGVGVVSAHGAAVNAQIVLGDTVYAIDEHNKLQAEYVNYIDNLDYSVRRVLTGNYHKYDDTIGESVYILVADEDNHFYSYKYRIDSDGKWHQGYGLIMAPNAGNYSADICNVDVDNDGIRIKLEKVTQGWADVKPLFVMEAPPYFDELHNGKYESKGNLGSTSISKSHSEGQSASYSAGISTSIKIGVEGDLDLLFTKIAGAEAGAILDASLTYSGSTGVERSLNITYTNDSGDNAVIVARAPYYIYEYAIDGTNRHMYAMQYGSPQVAGIPVDTYNNFARQFNDAKDRADEDKLILIDTEGSLLKLGTPGDPYSYRESFPSGETKDANEDMEFAFKASKQETLAFMGLPEYRTTTSGSKEVSYTKSEENGFDLELGNTAYLGATAAGIKWEVSVGVNASAGYCNFHSDSVTRSGTGAYYYNEEYPYNNYNFSWDFGFWDVKGCLKKGSKDPKYISVLGYTVSNISSPTVAPKDFMVSNYTGDAAIFSWELPPIIKTNSLSRQDRPDVASYKLNITNNSNGNTTVKKIKTDEVKYNAANGRYYYSFACDDLFDKTEYTCTLVCVSVNTNWDSVPSNEVLFKTEKPMPVTVTHGEGLELLEGGKESQKTNRVINTIYYRIKDGYELPEDYYGETQNGITVLVNDDIISVFGSPIQETEIEIPDMKVKTYSISYDLQYGEFSDDIATPYSYKITDGDITLPKPTQTGYEFTGWLDENGNPIETITAGSFGDRVFTPTWKLTNGVPYRVIYYLMDTNGCYSKNSYEDEVKYASIGEVVNPEPKEKVGFGTPLEKSAVVTSDGKTVITYEYPREKYNLDFKDSKTASIYGTRGSYYYDSRVPLEVEVQDDYYFNGWSKNRKSALEEYATNPKINYRILNESTTLYPLTNKRLAFEGITLTADDKEWDGNPVEVGISVEGMSSEDYAVEYKYYSGNVDLSEAPTSAGIYTVKAILTSEKNLTTEVTKEFKILDKYKEATYEWNEIYNDDGNLTGYTVTASRECVNNEKLNKTETVDAVYMVKTASDFENTGIGAYIAVFKNTEAFTSQEKEVVIPVREVEYDLVEASPSSCLKQGNIDYYQGTNGKVYLLDQNGKYQETTKESVLLPVAEHVIVTYKENGVDATYDSEGYYYQVTHCKNCGKTFKRMKVSIPKLERPTEAPTEPTTEPAQKVVPASSKRDVKYTVSVKNGTIDGKTSGSYEANTVLSVKANAPKEGYKFGYWKTTDSASAICYNETYTFKLASENIGLEAVYLEKDDDIERYGYSKKYAVDINKDERQITFSYYNNVPEDCTIVRGGVVATCDESKVKDLAVGIGSNTEKTTFEKEFETTNHNYLYHWTKTAVSDSQTWYVKGYLIYEDAQHNIKTVYSDLEKATLDGTETIVEEKILGTTRITSVTQFTNEDKTKGECIEFVSLSNVPVDCKILKAGLVATSSSTAAKNLTAENAEYVKYMETSKHTAQYTWTKTKVTEKQTWYVRPYLVYQDANGKQYTVYGELTTGKLK